MRDDETPAVRLTVAWRQTKWLVERDGQEVGAYAYRVHAMAHARTLSAEAYGVGAGCVLTIHEQDGRVSQQPCPGRRRRHRST